MPIFSWWFVMNGSGTFYSNKVRKDIPGDIY